jgi:hypothetical protein
MLQAQVHSPLDDAEFLNDCGDAWLRLPQNGLDEETGPFVV